MADYNTTINYNGDGTTTDFSIPFNYVSKVDVKVTRLGGSVSYTWLNANMIRLSAALAVGDILTIKRETNIATPTVSFVNGAVPTAQQFNSAFNQTLFAAQESSDTVNRGLFKDTLGRYNATGARIMNLGTPINDTDAATKAYADTVNSSVLSSVATAATSASNASASATAASVSAVAAANSAAAAAAALDNFDDRYLGAKSADPTLDNDGNTLVAGTLYFSTTLGRMRQYDGTHWIDVANSAVASVTTFFYTATAGQTTFSGADTNGATLNYTAGNTIVSLNGVILRPTSDYTATNGTSVVLTSGATVGDELNIISFTQFSIATVAATAISGVMTIAQGGTGVASIPNGYLKGNGSGGLTSSSTIPSTDVTGNFSGRTFSAGTVSSSTLDADNTLSDTGTIAANSPGFRGLPQNAQTAAYTLDLPDAGKQISITTGGVTIPANASKAFPIGSTIIIYNNSASNQTIAITTDTLRLAGTSTTGTRTLAQYGLATVTKVSATVWVISGAGVS